MNKQRDITFSEIRNLSNELAKDIATDLATSKRKIPFDCIIGIAKGGVIPATLLAYKLNINTFKTVQIKSYNDTNERSSTVFSSGTLNLFENLSKYRKVLLVDDLADSGKTLQAFIENFERLQGIIKLPTVYTACLYYKKKSEFRPEYYAQTLEDDIWVNFPWE